MVGTAAASSLLGRLGTAAPVVMAVAMVVMVTAVMVATAQPGRAKARGRRLVTETALGIGRTH